MLYFVSVIKTSWSHHKILPIGCLVLCACLCWQQNYVVE